MAAIPSRISIGILPGILPRIFIRIPSGMSLRIIGPMVPPKDGLESFFFSEIHAGIPIGLFSGISTGAALRKFPVIYEWISP